MRNRKRHSAAFGAASYGSAELALMHARTWRDALVKSLPPTERRARAEKVRTNNTTGIPGVFGLLSAQGKVLGWLAKTYLAHDQILRALFPVNGAGNDARSMAIQERARQLGQMTGLAKVHPAEDAIRKAPALSSATLPPKRSKSEVVRRNNNSGITGVCFKSARPGHPGYWMAITYTVGKGTVAKAFSVAEHGDEKAKKLAVAERQRQLSQKCSPTG